MVKSTSDGGILTPLFPLASGILLSDLRAASPTGLHGLAPSRSSACGVPRPHHVYPQLPPVCTCRALTPWTWDHHPGGFTGPPRTGIIAGGPSPVQRASARLGSQLQESRLDHVRTRQLEASDHPWPRVDECDQSAEPDFKNLGM